MFNFEETLKKAKQGNPHAQCNLGWRYSTSYGVEKNHKESVKWYRKAAEQGHARAQYYIGEALMDAVHVGDALIDVEKTMEEALQWHRKSALQGNACALLCVEYIIQHLTRKNLPIPKF